MTTTVILKLGGSLVTEKTKPFSIRFSVLKRLAQELVKAYKECCSRIIIVHGGGSFGHYVVKEHGGIDTVSAVTQTIMFMRELSILISDILTSYGLPTVVFDTHALAVIRNNDLYLFIEPILKALDLGLIPILYGDIVFGEKTRIVSGDEIVWCIGSKLTSSRLLFATTVDGVYDKDPSEPDAKLLDVVRLSDFKDILFSSTQGYDVTGGMRLKLELAYKYYSENIKEVVIFNGLIEGRTYEAICGTITRCSRVLRY
jgi:isopentenyl phosphate kinase